MRILHFFPDLHAIGNGIVNSSVDLACEQSRLGHSVVVASEGGEYERLLVTYGVEYVPLSLTRKTSNVLLARPRVARVLEMVKPDIAHAHTVTTALGVRMGRLIDRPPLVTTVHNEYNRSAPLMAVGDRVIAVSRAVAVALERRGVPKRKIRVVLNGTVGSPRNAGHERGAEISLCRPAVITVGGMLARKGISDLIGAFAEVATGIPNAHLYVVGDGPERRVFEAQARDTGFDARIHFTGYQDDPSRYLRSADLFVLASWREPFGLVISEAREAGCAIVASDVDGIPEVLEMGRAGRLVPAGDRHAFATAIKEVLTDEASLRSWRTAAQRNIEWLSTERVARETVTVYEELLDHRPWRRPES